jgi:antirestriction protein ArdC
VKNIGAIVNIGGDRAYQSPSPGYILLTQEHALRGRAEFAGTTLHVIGFLTSSPPKARLMGKSFSSVAQFAEGLSM